jgi:hypothetical protein|tara:strand:+ start:128 stop:427 length:300 start_codon:yes stop_codon:yes gene_type:complete
MATDGDINRTKALNRYIEEWYKYITPENAEYHFNRMLLDQDKEQYSLLKAKTIAQRHNFSDEFIRRAIEPYYSSGEAFCQLRGDTFWGDGSQFRPGDKT